MSSALPSKLAQPSSDLNLRLNPLALSPELSAAEALTDSGLVNHAAAMPKGSSANWLSINLHPPAVPLSKAQQAAFERLTEASVLQVGNALLNGLPAQILDDIQALGEQVHFNWPSIFPDLQPPGEGVIAFVILNGNLYGAESSSESLSKPADFATRLRSLQATGASHLSKVFFTQEIMVPSTETLRMNGFNAIDAVHARGSSEWLDALLSMDMVNLDTKTIRRFISQVPLSDDAVKHFFESQHASVNEWLLSFLASGNTSFPSRSTANSNLQKILQFWLQQNPQGLKKAVMATLASGSGEPLLKQLLNHLGLTYHGAWLFDLFHEVLDKHYLGTQTRLSITGLFSAQVFLNKKLTPEQKNDFHRELALRLTREERTNLFIEFSGSEKIDYYHLLLTSGIKPSFTTLESTAAPSLLQLRDDRFAMFLMKAIEKGDVRTIKLMLNHKLFRPSDVAFQANYLNYAVTNNQTSIVKEMLDFAVQEHIDLAALLTMKLDDGLSALGKAIRFGLTDILDSFHRQTDVFHLIKQTTQQSLLHHMVSYEKTHESDFFSVYHHDEWVQSQDHCQKLGKQLERGVDAYQQQLPKGINWVIQQRPHLLNEKNQQDGATPLYLAVLTKNLPAVKALIDAGADITARNIRSRTPLDRAKILHAQAVKPEEKTKMAEIIRLLTTASSRNSDESTWVQPPSHNAIPPRQQQIAQLRIGQPDPLASRLSPRMEAFLAVPAASTTTIEPQISLYIQVLGVLLKDNAPLGTIQDLIRRHDIQGFGQLMINASLSSNQYRSNSDTKKTLNALIKSIDPNKALAKQANMVSIFNAWKPFDAQKWQTQAGNLLIQRLFDYFRINIEHTL